MFTRLLKPPKDRSFFLFGPRGTGKTTWLKKVFPDGLYFDLLDSETYNDFLARPNRLDTLIPPLWNKIVILDEVQRVPALLHEVHRLIEKRKLRFALTGSSARKLKTGEVNLLAGRAVTLAMHPLTSQELGADFTIKHLLSYGHLPSTFFGNNTRQYLESYVTAYLREEVQQEGLTRNLGAFTRFLEIASFSQAQLLNISEVARECAVHRKVAEHYFSILEDLLIAERISVFSKKAKRETVSHQKFFFFDAGVYRTLRPRGPLDTPNDIDGAAMETAVYQEIRALNQYFNYGYRMHFWRTRAGHEVDFVLYGEKGLHAIEVKRSARVTPDDLKGLLAFIEEYPSAKSYLTYGGTREYYEGPIRILPISRFFQLLQGFLEI